jgi:hypothetical protein
MRFLSSGSFLFAIGVFFLLPWLDVRCEAGGESKSLMTQSGYEVAAGKVSENEAAKEGMGGQGFKQPGPGGAKAVEASPILYCYVAVVGLGALLSLVLPKGIWRQGVICCVAGAVAVMVIQLAHGFPIDVDIREFQEGRDKRMPAAGANPGAQMFGGPLGGAKIKVSYAPGYYIAWLLAALPLVAVALDATMFKKPIARKKEGEDDTDAPELD